MKKISIRLWVCLILVVAIALAVLPKFLINSYIIHSSQNGELPKSGLYICEDTAAFIRFNKDEVTIVYPDGTEENMNVDFHGRILGQESEFIAHYRWIPHFIEIQLTVERGNHAFLEEEVYIFHFYEMK